MALIVLTVVLSLTFESVPKDSKHLRSASNSTQNQKIRQKFSPKRAEVIEDNNQTEDTDLCYDTNRAKNNSHKENDKMYLNYLTVNNLY